MNCPPPTKNRINKFGSTKTKQIWEKSKGRCWYCGRHLVATASNKEDDNIYTIDHVIPVSKGGTKKLTNTVAACRLCNNLKGSSDNLDLLRMKSLILSDKMTKFNERQFEWLLKRGINLGRLVRYQFYFEKLGI